MCVWHKVFEASRVENVAIVAFDKFFGACLWQRMWEIYPEWGMHDSTPTAIRIESFKISKFIRRSSL